MSVLSDITGVIGLVQKAKQLADQLKSLELKEVIVDLHGKLLDLKQEIVQLRDENQRLTEDLKCRSIESFHIFGRPLGALGWFVGYDQGRMF